MKHWQNLSEDERRQVLEITSANKHLPQLAVEKDWWVTMTLKALSMTRHYGLMSFKGGTSLSKGWNLISRFSEDIDIALKREGEFSISSTSGTQLAKVRRAARHYIVRELPHELENALNEMGILDFTIEPEINRADANGVKSDLSATTHPSIIFINYKSVVPFVSDYVEPRVKIEISCLSMDEPVERKLIRSLMSDVLQSEEDVEIDFPTVVPTRTFLEKIFLLHEEFQKDNMRSKRMTRHLYDIEKIMDTPFGEAVRDYILYDSIVKHRSIFNKVKGVDYSLHAPATINIIPPNGILSEWEKDYESMRRNFIFETSSLPFNKLLDRINELMKRIRR